MGPCDRCDSFFCQAFECPDCGQEIDVHDTADNVPVRCPDCKTWLLLDIDETCSFHWVDPRRWVAQSRASADRLTALGHARESLSFLAAAERFEETLNLED